jgi:membrane-associated phospholipid phosphatase
MRTINTLQKALLFSSAIVLLTLSSCRKEDDFTADPTNAPENSSAQAERYPPDLYKADVVYPWYDLMNKLIKETPGHTPPIAARDIAYAGVALYESVTGEIQGHRSLAGQLAGLSSLPKRQVGKHYIPPVEANAAMSKIMKSLFANATAANLYTIDSLELALQNQLAPQFDPADFARSIAFGHDMADAVFNYSMSDGGHQAYLALFPASYVPPTGADKWVPTPPLYQPAMLPYWGNNRAFIPANNLASINPPLPPAFGTTAGTPMYDAAMVVYNSGINLTQAQKDIANFWADGGGTFTPPGHNVAIAKQLIRQYDLNIGEASIVLAKVGIALNDAGVVCWRAKFSSNLLRPISYIRTYIDPAWSSFIGTPPFPSYTSGHSTFSSSTASVLADKFGSNVSFTDSTKMAYGMAPRTYSSFAAAAQEAAVSRLYGGIHYEFDNVNGYNCGELVANNVLALRW